MSVTIISLGYLHHAETDAPISTSPSLGRGILSIVARTRKVRAVANDLFTKETNDKQKKG
jgi:hypothetical protein